MVAGIRLFGSVASAVANALLYGSLLAWWPVIQPCAYGLCVVGEPGPPMAVDTWRPFIDNPGPSGARSRREPECPEPIGAGDPYDLDAAPLPEGYDPHAYRERQVYACILVGHDGTVLAVRMLSGTGRQARDSSLVRTIRRSWRFRRLYLDAEPSWQRVRLNSGPVDGAAWDPPLPML